jgi:hypothetical protein
MFVRVIIVAKFMVTHKQVYKFFFSFVAHSMQTFFAAFRSKHPGRSDGLNSDI